MRYAQEAKLIPFWPEGRPAVFTHWLNSGCLAYLRERLEALRGFSFTTFSPPSFMWVARLQEPFFHLICGSGQDWQKTPSDKVTALPQPWQDSTMG
jgi:hypothetical protein